MARYNFNDSERTPISSRSFEIRKMDINERKCRKELENEFHFLLECEMYITIRKHKIILLKVFLEQTKHIPIF